MPQTAVSIDDSCWGNHRFWPASLASGSQAAWADRPWGSWDVKKLATAVVLCCALICSPGHAKTFVGVLWPMFGPTAAPGLIELVAELKSMPDVEVSTYLHQSWPSLVEEIDRQTPGTHTVVVGYSLGANSSVFVANTAKYVDLIIALQPSMLSWNPPVTGKVGRVIEIYNPYPWMTFGGMGSKKLIGENIEYIANYDSHPGAQFNSDFRNLVKDEVAKFAADNRLEIAKAAGSTANKLAQVAKPAKLKPGEGRLPSHQRNLATKTHLQIAQQSKLPSRPQLEQVAETRPKQQQAQLTEFVEKLSNSADSGNLSVERQLTISDLRNYAKRTYHGSADANLVTIASE
jgi:hypothetical protein